MASAESNSGAQAGWRGGDGRLWFATAEGAAVADPARWPVNAVPPPVTIERVIADEAPAMQAQPLPAGTRNVEFHYTAPSFVAPNRVAFRYRLAGFDHSWVEAGARRDAYYTNLPPGEYRFAVLAANSDGRWSPEPAVFLFSVAPFFYQPPAFIALCVALVAAGAGVLYWQRIHQLRARHAAVLAERNRMACELHDTLAQSLAGIGMQLEAAAHRIGEAPVSGFGLTSMRDRARRIGARMEIASQPGQGAVVTVHWPAREGGRA
jgi:signal transduction histidine kinase